MKKLLLSLMALTMVVTVLSCKKDPNPNEGNVPAVPVYKEGVYNPVMKVASVTKNGDPDQEWSWQGDNLDRITWIGGEVKSYTYADGYITKVESDLSLGEELRYTYADGRMTKCDVYYSGALALQIDLQHNEVGKISGGQITIDDNFLMTLAGQLLGQGSFFEKLVGTPAAETMVQLAQIAKAHGDTKLSISDKVFSTSFVWNGENVDRQVLEGSLVLNVTADDLDLLQQFIDIPEQYLSLIQMVMMAGGGSLPLQVSIADTISATYDDMYNPMFCNWGELLSPQTLSRANMLTMSNNAAIALSISMMGQSQELLRRPFNTTEEYHYEYNDQKYPTKVTGTDEIIYTYKN